MATVNFQSWCCTALRLAIPKMISSVLIPKAGWLVEVMMAIASWDLLRSTYDPGSDLLLFRIDMDDLIM